MTGVPLLLPSSVWSIASAAAIILIAATTLFGGRSRPRGALAFGLFGIFWGLQITLGNAVILASNVRIASLLYVLFLAAMLPVAYFLVEFAASLRDPASWSWRLLRAAAGVVALCGALVLAFSPDLLFQGVVFTDGWMNVRQGPLYFSLVTIPQFAAFALALVAMYRAMRDSPTPRLLSRNATLLAGLGIYMGFVAGNNLTFFTGAGLLYGAAGNVSHVVVFLALTLLILQIARGVLHARSLRVAVAERRWHALVASALLVSLGWGAVEGFLALEWLIGLETVGLWRLVGVAILAYGIARWRIFDLPQRAARTAASAAGASGALASGAAVYGLGTLVWTTPALPALLGLVVMGGTFIPGVRLARRILDRLGRAGVDSRDGVYGQRIDAYRAALEASAARNSLPEDEGFLEALRTRFHISAAEDRLLRHYVRTSLVVPRDGDAGAAYERLRLLGEGGSGRTWLARDRVRDNLVVLKEPLPRWQQEPTMREAVLREARLASRVRHAHVVAVESVVEDKGNPIIVMEYLEGGSLTDHLRVSGVLPWREAVVVMQGILAGVSAIHAQSIIHRDLKPRNVLLDGNGRPKVADFGIAIRSDQDRTVVDAGAPRAGTLHYLAPEVVNGASADRLSDVYACGAILHECLYGSPPGATVTAANDVPDELARILARALAMRPKERFESAASFAAALDAMSVDP